jgi:opacity protein-like surface antigen
MKLKEKGIIGLLVMANMIGFGAIGNACATEAGKKSNYVQYKAGMIQPTSGFDDAGYDTGFNDSLSYGRYLTNHLILEGTIDGSITKYNHNGTNNTAGNYTQKNNIDVTAFLLSLKEEYSIGHINLYGGAGIGAYIAHLYSKIDSDRFGTFKMDEYSDAVFGAHLLAGANYDITESWYLGIEGMYRWTGKAKIETAAISVPVAYNDNLNGFTLGASLGFRF